jgi:UDP:flavonoid glycosyltransferase YjiC (YdhE family)
MTHAFDVFPDCSSTERAGAAMKFTLACYGSRGEVEPGIVVSRALLERGHEVQLAVPPDLVGFAGEAGLTAVPYGPETQAIMDAHRDYWTCFFGTPWKLKELGRLGREITDPFARCWGEMSRSLRMLANGVDLVFTSLTFEQLAANVAEHYDIPLVTLHWFPTRVSGHVLPFLPAPLGRSVMKAYEWMSWGGAMKEVEEAQRRELGLPPTDSRPTQRIAERGSLEIQAYDQVCFPGLATEWANWNGRRPFVGTLTMELTTSTDSEVSAWISAGTPPIFFGFGSMPVESPADTVAMIAAACARLGERALVGSGSGWSEFSDLPDFEHVKVVGTVNFAAIFPACRAVVHHGGSSTTPIGLRSGTPTLILSTDLNQTLWGAQVKRLKVGTARRFSTTTEDSLVADLRTILAPQYAARARDIAGKMNGPAESAAITADLVENFARLKGVG